MGSAAVAAAELDTETTPKYQIIGCAFNHVKFYATSSPTTALRCAILPLKMIAAGSQWTRRFSGLEHQEAVPLCPSTVNPLKLEVDLERALRHAISSLRRNEMRVSTDWDDQLSYMLGPALCAYEMERLTGAAFGNEELQESIKRNVPEGHTFRGYPIVVSERSASSILAVFRRATIASDILRTKGDAVRFALRVKCVCYPG